MQIDDQLISRLELLARLQLSDNEKARLKTELDVSGVEPLVYLNEVINRPRADEVRNQVNRDAALRNAPDQDGTFFRVPKVIDK